MILNDRKRNRLAWNLLVAFATGVDKVRLRQKEIKAAEPGEELYREYLLTVLQGTDEISQRKKRVDILCGLLEPLFLRKDRARSLVKISGASFGIAPRHPDVPRVIT